MNSPKQILGDSVAVAVGVVGLIAVTNTYNTVLSTMQMRDHRDVHKTIQNINHMWVSQLLSTSSSQCFLFLAEKFDTLYFRIQIQSWCSDEERIAVLRSEGYAVVVTKEQWLYLRRDTQETVFTSLSSVLVNHKKIYMMRGDYHYSKESGPIELNQDVQIHAEPGTRLLVCFNLYGHFLLSQGDADQPIPNALPCELATNWATPNQDWSEKLGCWSELGPLGLLERTLWTQPSSQVTRESRQMIILIFLFRYYPDWKPVIYRKRDNVLFFSDNSRLFVPCMKPWVRRVALNMFSGKERQCQFFDNYSIQSSRSALLWNCDA